MPLSAPVSAPPWLGVDLGRELKPRIRWDGRAMRPGWICAGGGCIGWGITPGAAYNGWEKDRVRLQAWRDAQTRGPIMHPTAARLQADLDAAIAARPAGWWRRLLPGAGGGRP